MQVWCDWQVWSTPERIRGEVLTTMRYTNRRLPYLTTCIPCRRLRVSCIGDKIVSTCIRIQHKLLVRDTCIRLYKSGVNAALVSLRPIAHAFLISGAWMGVFGENAWWRSRNEAYHRRHQQIVCECRAHSCSKSTLPSRYTNNYNNYKNSVVIKMVFLQSSSIA